jgi:hypothetical protein
MRSTQRRVELPAGAASRLPANWDEDSLTPRMWDANGHAVGILAPGGYVVSTDPGGQTWELWTGGTRNAYDLAFNADGELFVYDSDMEWDFGTPWYRPTRVNHATSGAELGWRSGSGNWPACFPDSLPPLIDIGPGSPVGVAFGYGTRFPAKYQRALYVCDWTFGTIYAIHLEPEAASYRGVKEEFISRTPLPLTDLVVGADGAIYFAVGGRNSQSELYRIVYEGPEPTDPVDARNTAGAEQRQQRRDLEDLHRRSEDPSAAVARALPELAGRDRFIRYAARIADCAADIRRAQELRYLAFIANRGLPPDQTGAEGGVVLRDDAAGSVIGKACCCHWRLSHAPRELPSARIHRHRLLLQQIHLAKLLWPERQSPRPLPLQPVGRPTREHLPIHQWRPAAGRRFHHPQPVLQRSPLYL